MALSKFTPAQSVANQIRTKSLGVKTGGTQGRSNQVHKGVGLNRNSGGLNARGSGQKVTGAFAASAPKPAANPFNKLATTPRPMKGEAGFDSQRNMQSDPYRYVVRNGKRVAVRWSKLTPAERARFGGGSSPSPVPATTPPTDPAVAGRPTGPLDYRGLSSYMSGTANLDLQLAQDRAGLKRQLDENKIDYARAQGEARRGYSNAIEDSEDDMNRAGLLRSGHRERVDADRFREFNDHLAQVERTLGAGAAAQITEALAQLDAYEAQQRLVLEAQARDEYSQLYPAAPLDVTPAPANPAPSAPATSGGGGGGGAAAPVTKPKPAVSGVMTVPAGTKPPIVTMTLQDAARSFKGPRTYKAADGKVKRTAAWQKYLDDNGIKA